MPVTVARSFNQAVTENIQRRYFVGEKDILLDPDITPLLALTTNAGNRRKPAISTRVEWIEDDYLPVFGQVNAGADIASNVTNILVVDGTIFNVGDVVAVVRTLANSQSSPEVVRVTVIATNTLTITRGLGGFADTISSSNDLRILGPALAEGDNFPAMRSTTKSVLTSYTQIFRQSIQITKSMSAQLQFGAQNERLYQRDVKLKEHKRAIESAGLWSRASETLAAGAPGTIRTTMGFRGRISTNVTNANTTLTESGWLSYAEQAFKSYAGPRKVAIAAPRVISALDFFADGKLRLQPGDKVLGVTVQRYFTTHGELLIVRNRLMAAGTNSQGFQGDCYALDLASIEFAPLNGNGINRDTHLLENVVLTGADLFQDEWLTEGAYVKLGLSLERATRKFSLIDLDAEMQTGRKVVSIDDHRDRLSERTSLVDGAIVGACGNKNRKKSAEMTDSIINLMVTKLGASDLRNATHCCSTFRPLPEFLAAA